MRKKVDTRTEEEKSRYGEEAKLRKFVSVELKVCEHKNTMFVDGKLLICDDCGAILNTRMAEAK